MKRLLIISAVAVLAGFGGFTLFGQTNSVTAAEASAVAEEVTLTFAVENMTCALCPVAVRTAMSGVDGVHAVNVDFDAKTATVTFDPAVATAEAIGEASRNAGYPAAAIES